MAMTTFNNDLLLIDANSLIHRAFHALPPLTGLRGEPVQALYGLSSILLKIWREDRPEFAAALFDRPEPTLRKKQYPEYKAHRPPAPEGLVEQIIGAHELFASFGIATFEKPGAEADDLIATLAERFRAESGLRIVILTGDLDTLQLVSDDKVVVRALKRGVSETELYNESAVKARFGLLPRQLIDYKALVGDASDNIKGVPGIGPKTAAALLERFTTLDNLYENITHEQGLEKKLGNFKKQAELSRTLVTLDRQVILGQTTLQGLKIDETNKRFIDYFRSRGFEALIKRATISESAEAKGKPRAIQPEMFPKTGSFAKKKSNRKPN